MKTPKQFSSDMVQIELCTRDLPSQIPVQSESDIFLARIIRGWRLYNEPEALFDRTVSFTSCVKPR